MLAILCIKMQWTKENRTPTGSKRRQECYKPLLIEPDVALSGEGIFVKKCNYLQQGEEILSDVEVSEELEKQLYEENIGKAFTGGQEHEQRMAQHRNNRIRRDKGTFLSADKLAIPCIEIVEEAEQCYRIKWFDDGRGMPKRCGGNEDLYVKGAKLSGRANTLNETAFILREGESGVLKYNYRLAYYDGQWYECYYVYVVNTDKLSPDIFIRDYTYTYNQLADLF